MDFHRSSQPFRTNGSLQPETPAPNTKAPAKAKAATFVSQPWSNFALVFILVASAIVIFGAIILLVRPKNTLQYVDTSGYQAVDVLSGASGDQVYFGKISKITDKQIVLTNVFYPVSNDQTKTVTTLVPFICSLATPYDQLILNREQVAYWYNLQSSSKVTKTIDEYKKTNNGKANCDQLNSDTGTEQTSTDESTSANTGTQSQTPATNTTTNNTTTQKPTSTTPTTPKP